MPDLLFELRCEELPAKSLRTAVESMRQALAAAFAASFSASGWAQAEVTSAWTPRRIALFAAGLPASTAAKEERVRGPRVSAAFDASGAPTKAAEGFAKKSGIAATELVRDGDFAYAVVRTGGRPAGDVLAEILPTIPPKAAWAKTMRWGAPHAFARPIRGVVALFGTDVVRCTVNGLAAGRSTRGHAFLAPGAFDLASAHRAAYVAEMRKRFVLVDPRERTATISVAAKNASPETEIGHELLDEVTNLCEWPSALLGHFDESYLQLPPRLLTTVMAHHQRFFPVRAAEGKLRNAFVAILDRGAESVPHAKRGFERVLVPRLHDAMFFLGEDRKTRLEDRLEKLKTVTYHKKLGTVFDKVERLSRLAGWLATACGANATEIAHAGLAGRLAKCDLVTALVGEFPELQGHVGETYAREEGRDPAVCQALGLQYVHDFEDTAYPGVVPLALVLAENLDVVAKFGANVGLPTGSTDPFGVRRAALTLLDAARRWAPTLDLAAAVREAGGNDDVWGYLDTRLRQRLRDEGKRADFIAAVTSWKSVREFEHQVRVLEELSADPAFDRVLEVAERCRNIVRKAEGAAAADVEDALLVEPAEKELWRAWSAVRETLPPAGRPLGGEYAKELAATLAGPLHTFFEKVFVNADDPAVRGNRLALLSRISAAFERLGDLSKVAREAP